MAMADNDRRLPAWLLGLLIAIIVFTALFFLAIAFGYGDAPSIEGGGRLW
jgi:hypothetical protein